MKLATALLIPLALAACSKEGTGNDTAAAVAAVPAPAGQEWTDTASKTAEGYRLGNPDAPVKLVEYGSRGCPTCGAFGRSAMQPLENTYVKSGKVSYEFRDFLVHGITDVPLTLLGMCNGPATFFPLLEQMYQNQETYNGKLQTMSADLQKQLSAMKPEQQIVALAEQMDLINFVKQRGIPEAKARQCLADRTTLDAITKVTQDAGQNGTVTGTPTFLVNGKKLDNAVSWGDVEKALKAAGA